MPTPWRLRLFLAESAFSVFAFTGAIYLYFLVATWGLQEYLVPGPVRDYLSSPVVHLQQIMTGVMFGVLLGVVNRLTQKVWITSRSLGRVVLVRTALYLLALAVVFGTVSLLFLAAGIFSPGEFFRLLEDFSLRYLLSIGGFLVVVVVWVNFLLEIRSLVGQGNLWRLVTGHYRRPRAEERVFLFMDLVGSTSIAEKLGHERYSQFIQACFRDLTGVVLDCAATIYQYVGDEVVMTWPAGSDDALELSVRAFFAFEDLLSKRAPWYLDRFGVVPRFRGGIDVGKVTATEVGELKRDIAYHGDVLNTASRLLDLCREREGRLMVTGTVGNRVLSGGKVEANWRDEVRIRGKEGPTLVFSLEPSRVGDLPS
jgi:adenylate cyclase